MSFNSGFTKVESDSFLLVLGQFYDSQLIIKIKEKIDNVKSEIINIQRAKLFAGATLKNTELLAQSVGAGVIVFFKNFLLV